MTIQFHFILKPTNVLHIVSTYSILLHAVPLYVNMNHCNYGTKCSDFALTLPPSFPPTYLRHNDLELLSGFDVWPVLGGHEGGVGRPPPVVLVVHHDLPGGGGVEGGVRSGKGVEEKGKGRVGGGGRGIEKEKEGVEQEGGRERNEDGKGEERHRRSKGREIIDRWIEEKGRDGRKAIKRGKK